MHSRTKGILFSIELVILLAGLIYSIFTTIDYVKDYVFAIAVVIFVFYMERRYPLPVGLIITGYIALLLPTVAGLTFEFYALAFKGIGYDKFLHFTSEVVLVLIFYRWLTDHAPKRRVILHVLMVILMVLGINAIGEITEFVGSHYIHITGATMFGQGDLLPPTIQNDLVKYDTWWDLIFDLIGAVTGGILAVLFFTKRSKHSRSRTNKHISQRTK